MCRSLAQFASMAEIWRWEVGTWKAVGRLQSHSLDSDTLGVLLRLTFCACVSPEIVTSQFSLSKEQRFSLEYCPLSLCLSLSSLINSDKTMARLVTNSWQKAEAQKRFIWACSWRPFGHQFEPSSRDKTLKIWPFEKDARVKQVLALPQFGSSVTAVGWTRLDHKEKSRVHSIWDGGWS
ncbi:elongator complex protein 2-like isoform X3 [Brassica napus]|uniref:elongator complex protein 2-like isoform X3 n=1 Tax=Brassica napus TaxID=3708 RepID=UPI0006AAF545|nr:elongator complex protein 2-like isoform X3 [Brassica napus]